MEKMNSIPNERICDLVDGYEPDGVHAQALDALLSNRQAVQTWHAYHVIGDVLRSVELAPSSSDHAFLERLERRLASEPARPAVTATRQEHPITNLPSANASVFRWKMLAGVASFALVGVAGVSLWPQTGLRGDAQIAAQNPVVPGVPTTLVATDTEAGPMLRDARLDELMAAHRQLGGHSALQVPAGFLRNATHEGPAR
jgi:sigma-E factor negative regulatory protein RseA